MGSLDDVLDALGRLVSNAITKAGLPIANQVISGWPDENQLKKILKAGCFQVSIYPQPLSRNSTYAISQPWRTIIPENVTISAEKNDNVFALGGYVVAGLTVRLVATSFGPVITYVTVAGDTLESVAAALISHLAAASISATAMSAIIQINSNLDFSLRISGTATQIREARRVARQIQISVWAPSPEIRSEVVSAIESVIGSEYNSQLPIDENSSMWVRYQSDRQVDKSPADNTAYVNHLIFSVDYPIYERRAAHQITDIRVGVSVGKAVQADIHV